MAMTAVLTQTSMAIFGSVTNFVLAISNSAGVPVNVLSVTPTVKTPAGLPTTAHNISGPVSPPGVGAAQVDGSQFNVQVPAGGTVYFNFHVSFFGPAVSGVPAMPQSIFQVGADCYASDGSVFTPPPLQVELNQPTWGQPGGSPPNAAAFVPSLNFSVPANAFYAM